MTITDSPTNADQVWSVTEQSIPSGRPNRQNKKPPTNQINRLPRVDAVESVEQYFRFVHRVLEVNRHLALTWTGPVGMPSGVTRERAESRGRFLPEHRPAVAECPTSRAETAREAAGAQATPTQTDPAQDPEAGLTRTGHGDQRTTRGRPAPGLIDGLIGHLLDLDIAGSLSTNHPGWAGRDRARGMQPQWPAAG